MPRRELSSSVVVCVCVDVGIWAPRKRRTSGGSGDSECRGVAVVWVCVAEPVVGVVLPELERLAVRVWGGGWREDVFEGGG